jgi:protein-disulfide isomerase
MLKLLATTLLLSSFLYANTTSEKVEQFLEDQLESNSRIVDVNVTVVEVKPLKQLKGWDTYIVAVEAILKDKPKETIKQQMIWFSNGQVITKELNELSTGDSFTEMVKPNFQDAYYTKKNLVYGDADAKHKIAIFSDPLCPFCTDFAPKALSYMKKYPKTFAVYYFHYPIIRIHPASGVIVRAAIVAENQGIKDVTINMYKTKINPRERNIKKILVAFNKAVGSNVTQKEINAPYVKKQLVHDNEIARKVFVAGTPTIYVDGKIDKTRKLYKSMK